MSRIAANDSESKSQRFWRRLIGGVLVIYWLALFVSTHVPMPRMNDLPKGSDKGMHFIAYAGLGGLLALWLLVRGATLGRVWMTVPVVCLAYAIADELLQLLISTRSADVLDGAADLAGAVTAVAAVSAVWLARTRRKRG
jgi:VanZ family protein